MRGLLGGLRFQGSFATECIHLLPRLEMFCVCVCVYVCICVCVCERERERKQEREREKERERERECVCMAEFCGFQCVDCVFLPMLWGMFRVCVKKERAREKEKKREKEREHARERVCAHDVVLRHIMYFF